MEEPPPTTQLLREMGRYPKEAVRRAKLLKRANRLAPQGGDFLLEKKIAVRTHKEDRG